MLKSTSIRILDKGPILDSPAPGLSFQKKVYSDFTSPHLPPLQCDGSIGFCLDLASA